jgi:hypothetical protein
VGSQEDLPLNMPGGGRFLLLSLLFTFVPILRECVGHDEGKARRSFGIHLHLLARCSAKLGEISNSQTNLCAVCPNLNLSPGDSLIWPGACIATIKFLPRVDVHRGLGPVPHQTSIRNMMLHDPAAQDDHSCPLRSHRNRVNPPYIFHNIDPQLFR